MNREHIRMPIILRHVMWAVIGVSGYYLIQAGGKAPQEPLWLVIKIFLRGVFAGCSWYGIVSLIRDFRVADGSVKDFLRKIAKTHKDVFKNREKK